MKNLKINNDNFYRSFNICESKDLKEIKELIDLEYAKGNIVWTHPLYQTWSNLHDKLKHVSSFNRLKNKIINLVKDINKDLKLTTCWCNLSVENNYYVFHQHKTKLTCVFYLHSKEESYGLRLEEHNIIFPAVENSVVIFDGGIAHSIEHMPNKVFDSVLSHRYSVVFDFI